jgi:hypothetical protein
MAAIADDEAGVRMALEVCGASDEQQDAIVAEGFENMSDLTVMEEKDITDMMTNITRLPVNRGGVRIGAVVTRKVKALVYWCKEQKRRGKDLDANRFTEEELEETLTRMSVETADDDTKPELPTKFDTHKWVSWVKKVENYMWQVKGKNNTPLMYVIRKTRTVASPPFASEQEERIYQTAHAGPAYMQDRQKVFQLLTQMLSGTPAWTWISSHENTKNGRMAFEALRQHYDGPGQVEKRLAYAYNILNNTHYKSERQYSFESFVTKLSEAFEILKDNDVAKSEREKVDFLLNGIQSDNQIIVTAKTTVRMNVAMRTSFQIAVDHLSELIGATFSNASNNGKRPARNVSQMNSRRGGRGGRGRGGRGGRGRGGRGNRGGKFHNNVDITDLARTYTDEEWRNLSPEIHQQIRDARAAKRDPDANAKKRNVAAVSVAEGNVVEATAEPEETAAPATNGSGFGSGAYKRANRAAQSN